MRHVDTIVAGIALITGSGTGTCNILCSCKYHQLHSSCESWKIFHCCNCSWCHLLLAAGAGTRVIRQAVVGERGRR